MLTIASVTPSLIDPASINGMYILGIIAICVLIVADFVALAYSSEKNRPIIAVVIMLPLIAAIVCTMIGANSRSVAIEKTNANIEGALNTKYGVTILESIFAVDENGLLPVLDKGLIPAKDVDGKRIKISVEFADNDTDVLAFSLGGEMPILGDQVADKS